MILAPPRIGTLDRASAMCWTDIPVRYTVTMLGQPGQPMLTLVDEEELARRKNRRARSRSDREFRAHYLTAENKE